MQEAIHIKKGWRIVWFRWLILLPLTAIYAQIQEAAGFVPHVYLVLVPLILYCSVLHAATYKVYARGGVFNNMLVYVDVLAVCVMILVMGGVRTELFVLIPLLLFASQISDTLTNTLRLEGFSILCYTLTVWNRRWLDDREMDLWLLLFRYLLLIVMFGVILAICWRIQHIDKQRKKDRTLAWTDHLTGLANRHYFQSHIHEEISKADKEKMQLYIAMFDLDHFKKFNDTYGHIYGDRLLQEFAAILANNAGKKGLAVRYGGEEFIFVQRGRTKEDVIHRCEDIRMQLERLNVYIEQGQNREKVTVSCGTAVHTGRNDIAHTVQCADKALYKAKSLGRNRIVFYEKSLIAKV